MGLLGIRLRKDDRSLSKKSKTDSCKKEKNQLPRYAKLASRPCLGGQCLSLRRSHVQLTDLLGIDYLRYFSQPRPAIANYSPMHSLEIKLNYLQLKLKTLSPITADLQRFWSSD